MSSSTKTKKRHKASTKTVDRSNYYWLLGTVYVMILFGLVMILSASSVRAYASMGDSYYYIKKQLLSLGIGSVLLLICYWIPTKRIQSFAPHAMFVVIALLAAVLIPGIGKEVDGASRWISLAGFRLQPSEFAKIAVIIFTADYLARKKDKLNDIRDLIYPYGFVMGLIVLLVMKQPDMGTTLAICLGAFAVIFINGINLRYVFGILVAGGGLGTAMIFAADYRFQRLTAFLNPSADPLGAGWQIKQSMLAFGSGGLLGIGLAMGRQKYFYLPAAHTDFIFAIIGEELGLMGTLFTVSLFVVFAYYGIKVSLNAKSRFSKLLGAGITSMIVLQAIINMGAVTAILPITGIPMPFISYGGSSLMVNLAAIGILLGIAVESERNNASKRKAHSETGSKRSSSHPLEEEFAEIKDLSERREKKKSGSTKHRKKSSKTSTKASTKGSAKTPARVSVEASKKTSKSGQEKKSSSRSQGRSETANKGAHESKPVKSKSSAKEDKATGSTGRTSEFKYKTRTQKRQSHASNNKRGRDSGARVPRSGSRQGSSKDKREY